MPEKRRPFELIVSSTRNARQGVPRRQFPKSRRWGLKRGRRVELFLRLSSKD